MLLAEGINIKIATPTKHHFEAGFSLQAVVGTCKN